MLSELSALRQDALRELSNIGLGNAVTALSDLTRLAFTLEVPQVHALEVSGLGALCTHPECLAVGTVARIEGDWAGDSAFLFPWESARVLWTVLMGQAPNELDELNELHQSVITEIANIMLGNFLNGLSQMTGFELHMSPPAFAADMTMAILSSLMVEALYENRELLAIETHFYIPDQTHAEGTPQRFEGFFFYFPEVGSLERLFSALSI